MPLTNICHLCSNPRYDWTLRQSSVSVGKLQGWQASLCEDCTTKLEQRIVDAIKELRK